MRSSEPRKGVAICRAKAEDHFSVKPLSNGLSLGIDLQTPGPSCLKAD